MRRSPHENHAPHSIGAWSGAGSRAMLFFPRRIARTGDV